MTEPGRGAEPSWGARRSRWLPAVRDRSLSEPKSVLSFNNTRWPTRRHARHVTARSLRHAPCSAPAPPGLLPAHPQPPTTSFLSAASCRSSPDTPLPKPRMSGWRRRGDGRAQAPAGRGPGLLPALELSRVWCPELDRGQALCDSPSWVPNPELVLGSKSSASFTS